MDGYGKRMKDLVGRYKYVAMVVLVGVLLMLLPMGEDKQEVSVPTAEETGPGMGDQLEQILSQIEGVGQVRVLLTVSRSEETVYIYDTDSDISSESESLRRDVVLLTDGDRAQSGLIGQIISPVYQGAIVVCQGGDQPGIQLQVVEAVCDATGLTADKVTVLKMK